jgi:hypothetical protein
MDVNTKIKPRIFMPKAEFSKKWALFTSKTDTRLRRKPKKCYIWCKGFCGNETWTLRKLDQEYLESF